VVFRTENNSYYDPDMSNVVLAGKEAQKVGEIKSEREIEVGKD
jgi:hypothetical protein